MTAREYVEYLLKNYHGIKRDTEQLKLELEYFQGEEEDETIQGMMMNARELESSIHKGGVSDATSRIALIYREANHRINTTTKKQIERLIRINELEIKKLDMAIQALEERTRRIMIDLYINRLSWNQICMKHYISPNTLNRYRKKGIAELTTAYEGGERIFHG